MPGFHGVGGAAAERVATMGAMVTVFDLEMDINAAKDA